MMILSVSLEDMLPVSIVEVECRVDKVDSLRSRGVGAGSEKGTENTQCKMRGATRRAQPRVPGMTYLKHGRSTDYSLQTGHLLGAMQKLLAGLLMDDLHNIRRATDSRSTDMQQVTSALHALHLLQEEGL